MIRFVCVAAICGCFLIGVAYAQSGGCPTGFMMQPAQLGEQLADLNLDGQVCRSEADVRPNGLVETVTFDNDAQECVAPGIGDCPSERSGFQGPFPAADLPGGLAGPGRADRNGDTMVCVKTVVTGSRD